MARSCGFVFVWSCWSVGRCPLFLFKAVCKASGWSRDGFGKQARVVSPNDLAVHVVFLYGPEKRRGSLALRVGSQSTFLSWLLSVACATEKSLLAKNFPLNLQVSEIRRTFAPAFRKKGV